jgi:hypothetical protein
VRKELIAVAFVVASVAGCGSSPNAPLAASHLTINGDTHTTRPAKCSQLQGYRTLDIRDQDSQVEAVVLLSGFRAIPQWVKIRNVAGFTGSFWQGGVGDAHVDVNNDAYTITGSAYGISSSNPNKVITTDFKLTAEC